MKIDLQTLMAVLICGPIALGLLAFISPGRLVRSLVVAAAASITMAAGIIAALKVIADPTHQIKFALGSWGPETSLFIEIALVVVIILIGLKIRNVLIFLLGFAQFFLTLAESAAPKTAEIHTEEFLLDPLGIILVLIISIVGSIIVLFAIGYMKEHEHHAPPTARRNGTFFLFLVGFLGAMNGLVLSDNLRWLSIFWEMTTLCSFMLIGHDGTPEARRNATRALLLNSIGGVAMMAGSYFMAVKGLGEDVSSIMAGKAVVPMALLCLAAFTKSAQLPFQSWLLGAMIAPTPVSALLHSATMVKAGSYLVLRLAPAFAGMKIMYIIALAGALTFAVASALAVSQSNAKKVLAYSTIANLGLIVACAGINTPLAYAAALMILCFHAISKGLLFLCVGTIEQKIGSRDIEDMGGIMFKMPLTTTIASIGMASMLIPPFGMLLSKWMAIEAAIAMPAVLLLIVVGSALTVLFWAKWMGRIQTVSYTQKYAHESLRPSMLLSNLILAAGVIVAGVAAAPLYNCLFDPLARHTYAEYGVKIAGYSEELMKSASNFAYWPIIAFLALPLLAWILTARTIKPAHISLPFLCGENTETPVPQKEGEAMSYAFRSLKDQPDTAWAATMYFKAIFNEPKITFWGNLIALLVLLAMFGVIKAI